MTLDSVLPLEALVDDAALDTDDDDSLSVFEDADVDDTDLSAETEETDDRASTPDPYKERIATLEKRFGPNWIDRVEGLQGSLQQAVETARAAEARAIELENAAFQREIEMLDPVQQQVAWQQLETERRRRQEDASTAQQRTVMEQMAKAMMVQQLSQKYGIPADKLARFDHPQAMLQFAEMAHEERKTTRRQQRKEKKASHFEGAAPVSQPSKKPSYNGDIEAAAFDFAKMQVPVRR